MAVPPDPQASVVAIGVFDGVHRGHQLVLAHAASRARAAGLSCVALTFDPHPVAVLRPDVRLLLLSSVGDRAALLRAAGADRVEILRFTSERAAQSAEDFVRDVLVSQLHAKVVVVGADFRFGHKAAGDVDTLRSLGSELGFEVDPVPLVGDGVTARWSSTGVRARLAEGDVAGAAEILGRPHRLSGEVVHGDHRGRELGYPTANVQVAGDFAVPPDGVYSGWLVRSDGERLPAAISIGTNPTFDGTQHRVEAYVLDRDDLDLYGEQVAVEFAQRLRGMERFESVDELVRQMAADVVAARAQVGQAP